MIRSPWVALAILTGINAANYIDRYVAVSITPLLAKDFHLSNQEVGELTTAFFLVYTLTAPVLGLLGDRIRRTWIISLSVGLWSVATAAGVYCPTFHALLWARAAVGIGEAGYGSSCPSLISDLFSKRRRGLALSLFSLALPVGTAIGYALGGWMSEKYGWREALKFIGIPGLALSLLVLFVAEPERGAQDAAVGEKSPDPHAGAHGAGIEDYKQLLVNVPFLYVCAGMAAMTFMMGGLAAFAPKFLVDVRGLTAAKASSAFGLVTAVAGFVGTLAGGLLSEKVAQGSTSGQLWVSGVGLIAAAPLCAIAILSPDSTVFFTLLFLGEVCLFLNTGPLNAAIANVVPASVRTAAYSLNILFIHVFGDIPSPIGIGWLADRTSLTVAMASTSLFAAAAGVILLVGSRRVQARAAD